MKLARFGASVAAMLAMSGAWAVALAEDRADDAVRQRAEDLAQIASERFDDFLRPQRFAQAQTGKAAAKDTANDTWSSPSGWIEHSNREYQQLMQRLSQASEPAKPAQKPAAAPAEKTTAPAEKQPEKKVEKVEKKAAPSTAVAEKSGQLSLIHISEPTRPY